MSIIKKLLGGPGFYMEAGDVPPESAKPSKVQPAVVKAEPKAPIVEKVVAEAPAEVAAPVETETAIATAVAPTKTSIKKKKAAEAAAVEAPTVEAATPIAVLTDVQSLVETAIAQASAEKRDQEAAAERTFATDYLLVPTMNSRRKPGPSLNGFMDMVSTMKR